MTEVFSFLTPINSLPNVRASWIERSAEFPQITGDRDEAMRQLRPFHEAAVARFAGPSAQWFRAEQVHGADVAIVPNHPSHIAPDGLPVMTHVDGLITNTPGIVLAIYVADCGAIWLTDRKTGAIGLLHSGKKGTEGNILNNAITAMQQAFGTNPKDVIATLSPCIRPPDYEVDFAKTIAEQAEKIGIGTWLDSGLNTASDLSRFYSYRKELGRTGRMMALIVRE